MKLKLFLLSFVVLFSQAFSWAQEQEKPVSKYDANELFNPLF
jgi:hypothetical protein